MTNADLDRLDVLLSARDWAADLGVCEAATSGPWLSNQLWECRGLPLHEVPEFIVTSELPDEDRTILFIACLRHTTQQVALNWPDEAPMDEGPVGLRECGKPLRIAWCGKFAHGQTTSIVACIRSWPAPQ